MKISNDHNVKGKLEYFHLIESQFIFPSRTRTEMGIYSQDEEIQIRQRNILNVYHKK